MDTSNYDEIFRYTVRTLVNPLGVKVNEIMIANVSQLASLHFFNVESKPDADSGLVSFPITTISEEDSEKLSSIDIFLENYFYRVRLFRKRKTIYRVKLEDLTEKTVKVARMANFIERLLFNKMTVIKVIPVTELFEEYKVYTGSKKSV
ncbi:MAG: hypothetical protein RR877_01125 [Aurantimicrobium sp.]|uniref:hypothetical protein n=1 Tax=Aurantimicrobium sp. TaxID=1930784 RepID=UPI002FCAC32B